MATATATVQSSLSSAKTCINSCLPTKPKSCDNPFLVNFGHATKKSYSSLVYQHCCYNSFGSEPIFVSYVSKGRRARRRIAATVAEEETVVETGAEAEAEVTEPTLSDEGGGGGGEEVQEDNSTKLYFGNLPYLCDSAQLAGIVQQYGTLN